MTAYSEVPALSTQTILIVDDNPTNIGVVADYLENHGFTILVARDGESALDKAAYARPHLILLDVMMPGLDGFETCRRLKADDTTSAIPVIFMTALTDVDDKVKGFAMGAVDYVTKPLQQEEVLARVTTHLRIRALTEQLQESNSSLAQLNADKDRFFSILAHDLRGPFLPLLGSAEMLSRRAEVLPRQKINDMSRAVFESAQRVLDLLENLLQWGRLQIGRTDYAPQNLDLHDLVSENIALLKPGALTKDITLHNQVGYPCHINADVHMFNFVLRNLLSNAIKFTPSAGEVFVLSEHRTDSFIAITIKDNGVGINPKLMDSLFRLDSHHSTTGTANETGTGLGLILCREMVERNRGEIWVESQEGEGTAVTFTIPIAV